MPYKDPIKAKEKKKEYYEKNKEQNKEKRNEYKAKCRESSRQHANDSIKAGKIIDQYKWDQYCNHTIKSSAMCRGYPYSNDFTNDIMFEMMVKGCFYCGNIATSIDRINSNLTHTLDNCVGCCNGCNISKGAADPLTFIRKAYYRTHGKYYDDDIDIWFINKQKPRIDMYKARANKQGVLFDLTKEDFNILLNGNCAYCHRSPSTWFGVDRVVPSLGYVINNVVSCCWDCNNDKSGDNIDIMMARNELITNRFISGELVIKDCEKIILHNGH
jgi:hypothetical protein